MSGNYVADRSQMVAYIAMLAQVTAFTLHFLNDKTGLVITRLTNNTGFSPVIFSSPESVVRYSSPAGECCGYRFSGNYAASIQVPPGN
jgi:hypothetical protein